MFDVLAALALAFTTLMLTLLATVTVWAIHEQTCPYKHTHPDDINSRPPQ